MSKRKFDREDAESLCGHIDGHVLFARAAIAAGDAAKLEEQAEEIIGWAQSLKAIAKDAR